MQTGMDGGYRGGGMGGGHRGGGMGGGHRGGGSSRSSGIWQEQEMSGNEERVTGL